MAGILTDAELADLAQEAAAAKVSNARAVAASADATVSTKRGAVAINQHVRIQVQSPKPENMTPEGVQISTTILAPPGTDWRTGDKVYFEVIDGFPDLDQVAVKEVLSAARDPRTQRVIVYLRGTIQ